MLGEILIAGLASMLICIFCGPKFIEWMREREFGQHIREEGPAGHHHKAGTPTMGGLLIFLAVSVPFLILGDYDAGSLAVFGTAIASAALGFADEVSTMDGLELQGLMTLPPMPQVPEDTRPWFVSLRELLAEVRAAHPQAVELSMGMSMDYEVAVEEGATMVRVGTALFGERPPAGT